jgi:HEAT repeat protein
LARVAHAELRTEIGRALAAIGSRQCTDASSELQLELDADLRCHAVRVLGEMGEAGALPRLREALEDEAWIVRKAAALALESSAEHGVPSLVNEAPGSRPGTRGLARAAPVDSLLRARSSGGS